MTDCERIWAYFEQGGTLTVAEAISKVGVYALSQRCGDLRRQGKDVKSWSVKLPSGKWVSRYGNHYKIQSFIGEEALSSPNVLRLIEHCAKKVA